MALVLVFGLLPVSAMAEAGDWDPLTNLIMLKDIMGVRIIEDLVLRNLLLVQELANSR